MVNIKKSTTYYWMILYVISECIAAWSFNSYMDVQSFISFMILIISIIISVVSAMHI